MRSEPLFLKVAAGSPQMGEHLEKVASDKFRQHETVVECRTPADQTALERRFPKCTHQGADQQHLQKVHSYIWRHFECSQFEQAKLRPESLRRKEFVHAKF